MADSIEDEAENSPQPAISSREGKYQRPDVTQYDRLDIAHRYLDPNRPWGEVTKMAQEYALSRVTIGSATLTTSLRYSPAGTLVFST